MTEEAEKLSILDAWDICRAHWQTAAGTSWVGAIPCVGAFVIMHGALEATTVWWKHWGMLVTLAACLGFSVRTVYLFGEGLFGEGLKAALLVVSLEGLMAFLPDRHIWLSMVALAALVGINGVATVCHTVSQRTKPTLVPSTEEPESPPALPEPSGVPALSRTFRRRTRGAVHS